MKDQRAVSPTRPVSMVLIAMQGIKEQRLLPRLTS
jgi:hypothetical protein